MGFHRNILCFVIPIKVQFCERLPLSNRDTKRNADNGPIVSDKLCRSKNCETIQNNGRQQKLKENGTMKTNTRVFVIGGGVMGCSVLYHLTKLGWTDIMLVEKSELTSGSTCHAAGGFHNLKGDSNLAALQGYTIRLYKELEEITGMSCGLHHIGSVTLADNHERFDMLLAKRAKHRYMALATEFVGPKKIAKIAPAKNIDGIIGGLYDPLDGHLDHSFSTYAYAKSALMGGATNKINTKVMETNQRRQGSRDVITD